MHQQVMQSNVSVLPANTLTGLHTAANHPSKIMKPSGIQKENEQSHQLPHHEEQIFRRRYRFYLETYHDINKTGQIRLYQDMLARLNKYPACDQQAVKRNVMAIWSLMTGWQGAAKCEVSVEEAIENYLNIMHSPNIQIQKQGKAIITSIATRFFNQLDVDKDGVISLEKWMSHYSRWCGTSIEECKKCFSRIDVEGVGFLCKYDVIEAVQGFFFKTTPVYYNDIFGPIPS